MIGASHHYLLCLRNPMNSDTSPVRLPEAFAKFVVAFGVLTVRHDRLSILMEVALLISRWAGFNPIAKCFRVVASMHAVASEKAE